MKQLPDIRQETLKELSKIEKKLCGCNFLFSYICDVHKNFDRLREIYEELLRKDYRGRSSNHR